MYFRILFGICLKIMLCYFYLFTFAVKLYVETNPALSNAVSMLTVLYIFLLLT